MTLSTTELVSKRATIVLLCVAAGCGTGSSAAPSVAPPSLVATGYAMESSGGSLSVVAGDALHLSVVRTMSDGTTSALATTARVVWSGPPTVKALPNGSSPDTSILPPPGATATSMWLDNPVHFSAEQLQGVLWVLDPGTAPNQTITVTATVTDGDTSTNVTAAITVGLAKAGDAALGKAVYAANCAECHGTTGQGSEKFPGLNNKPENVAGDPSWSAALMTMTARSDMDNKGVSLDPAMPKWLVRPSSTGRLLTTEDFADIYAWLKTQTQ